MLLVFVLPAPVVPASASQPTIGIGGRGAGGGMCARKKGDDVPLCLFLCGYGKVGVDGVFCYPKLGGDSEVRCILRSRGLLGVR